MLCSGTLSHSGFIISLLLLCDFIPRRKKIIIIQKVQKDDSDRNTDTQIQNKIMGGKTTHKKPFSSHDIEKKTPQTQGFRTKAGNQAVSVQFPEACFLNDYFLMFLSQLIKTRAFVLKFSDNLYPCVHSRPIRFLHYRPGLIATVQGFRLVQEYWATLILNNTVSSHCWKKKQKNSSVDGEH